MTLRSSLVKKTVKKAVTAEKIVRKEKTVTVEVEIDNNNLKVLLEGNADDFVMSADIEEMPGCCGVRTLVDLNYEGDFFIKKAYHEQIAKALDKELETFFISSTKGNSIQRGITVLVTTNDKPWCALWASVLSKSKFFKKTKVWKNRASGNIVTLWVSA